MFYRDSLNKYIESIHESELDTFIEEEKNIIRQGGILGRSSGLIHSDDSGGIVCSTSNSDVISNAIVNRILEHNDSKINQNHFKENVGENIIKIGTGTFHELLKLGIQFKEEAGEHFYGMLLKNTQTGAYINPFHVMTAIAGSTSGCNILTERYLGIVYIYSDLEDLKAKIPSDERNCEKIETNINSLIMIAGEEDDGNTTNSLTTGRNIRIIKTSLNRSHPIGLESLGSMSISYREPIEENARLKLKMSGRDYGDNGRFDINNGSNKVVPVQILSSNTVVPYYGAVLINTQEHSVKGINLSPFKSCNLSEGTMVQNPNFGSVCTGSKSNRTLEGLMTLSYSNTLSPYSSGLFVHGGALDYAKKMIDKSIEIYKVSGVINE